MWRIPWPTVAFPGRSAAVVAVLAMSLAPVSALNPLDNDAGSGGDAGDTLQTAVPVGLSQYEGRVFWPADEKDFYVFDITDGATVRVRLTTASPFGVLGEVRRSDGQVYQGVLAIPGFEETLVYFPQGGPWYFSVKAPFLAPVPVTYEFSLTAERWTGVVHDETRSPVHVVEVTWSEPATVEAVARFGHSPDTNAAATPVIFLEYRTEQGGEVDYWWIACSGGQGAFGQQVAVYPPVVPPVSMPFNVRFSDDGGWCEVWTGPLEGTGWIRFVGVHAHPSPDLRFTALGTKELQGAADHGERARLVVWGDDPGAWQVTTPALAATSGRDFDLDIQGRFVGRFLPGFTLGTVERPDGSSSIVPPLFGIPGTDSGFLILPEPGVWRFHLAPEAGAGPYTVWQHLAGAFGPDLGVAG